MSSTIILRSENMLYVICKIPSNMLKYRLHGHFFQTEDKTKNINNPAPCLTDISNHLGIEF